MIAKIILLKKTDGRKSIMMRLTQNRKKSQRVISAPFSPKQWNYNPKKKKNELKVVTPPRSNQDSGDYNTYVDNKNWVLSQEKKYQDIINGLIRLGKNFSFGKVWKIVDGKPNSKDIPTTVYVFWDWRIEQLRADDDLGNVDAYRNCRNKLQKFHKHELTFDEMDSDFILDYKKSMKAQGLKNSTIHYYLRTAKAIYNSAVKNGVANANGNPFLSKEAMDKLTSGHKSRAIGKDEIEAIRQLRKSSEEGSDIFHGCSIFLLGYLSYGANFMDWARFKWTDINNGRLYYIRWKTRKTIDDEVNFGVNQEMAEILAYYKRNNRSLDNPYILPVLSGWHDTELKRHNRIKKRRKWFNDSLKLVGKAIDSSIPLTSYVYRHSFASVGKNDLGLSNDKMRELLNHKDLKTTDAYLASFSDDAKDKMVQGL